MALTSILSVIDRLSAKTVLTNSTASVPGCIFSFIFVVSALIMFIPPVYQYLSGNFFESEFYSYQIPSQKYYSNEDFLYALSFRHKTTNQYANHTQILQKVKSQVLFISSNLTLSTDIVPCQPQLFITDAINPTIVEQCLMIPSGLQYDTSEVDGFNPFLSINVQMQCDDIFRCNSNNLHFEEATEYIKTLADDYYYEVIFSSTILDERGKTKKQIHKVYSSEYLSPDGEAQSMTTFMSRKTTIIDDSVMPWWNNVTHNNFYWTGKATGTDVSKTALASFGFYSDLVPDETYILAYRYYKKLDFLIGMLGGGVFLLFLIFWIPCSYVNRTFQKIQNAEELFVQKDEIITTDLNLKKVQISSSYLITNLLPGKSQQTDLINESERQIDIVRLIKKLKVAKRNLSIKNRNPQFKAKDINFGCQRPNYIQLDRPSFQVLGISHDSYQTLKESKKVIDIYENNPTVMAITENSQIFDDLMEDQIFDKKSGKESKRISGVFNQFTYCLRQTIRFFDVFGAKPMFNTEPESSSCFGFLLTVSIIFLSIGTFALTLQNSDKVQIITSYEYQSPEQHSYQMVTGEDLRFAACFDSKAVLSFLTGASRTGSLTFYQFTKTLGKKQIQHKKMNESAFQSYFQLDADHLLSNVKSQFCFKMNDGQEISMGGSYGSQNEAYFGFEVNPYCSGTIQECIDRQDITRQNYLNFINYRTFSFYISENKYEPQEGKLIPGIWNQLLSQSNSILNATIHRTQTIYVPSTQLLDDTSSSLARQSPKVIEETLSYYSRESLNMIRKADPTQGPGYTLQIRPNGQKRQITKRSYKLDYIVGIIGGCFLFWYFIAHFPARMYNSFKVRAKLANILYRENSYNENFFRFILHILKIPSKILCCSDRLQNDIRKMSETDMKIRRDLNYLNLVKKVDSCFRLSTSLFDPLEEKDLALVYFKQKVDESSAVRSNRVDNENLNEDDENFMDLDELEDISQQTWQIGAIMNESINMIPENSIVNSNTQISIDKIMSYQNKRNSVESEPFYDLQIPEKQKEHSWSIFRLFDLFKVSPELTLNGQRDVKSIFGGIVFCILFIFIVIICSHWVGLFLDGSDYTVSYRRFIDEDLNVVEKGEFGELQKGIHLQTGKNFKFRVSFEKKEQYYPHNVSEYVGSSIGIRMMKIKITKENGTFTEQTSSIPLQLCTVDYLEGWLGRYDDKQVYIQNLTNSFCVPDNHQFSLTGTPEDNEREYFKLNIYNKLGNQTGKTLLNSFMSVYIPRYFMSVPEIDVFADQFDYKMTSWSYFTGVSLAEIQTNLTFSKLLITDKYFSRSRETYNDKTQKKQARVDVNFLSDQYQRNVTFYYDGIIDHYVLDFPSSAEILGMVGGCISVLVLGMWCMVSSFNRFRMKYLIGQSLYTFDKKFSGFKDKHQNQEIDIKALEKEIKKINKFSEPQLLLAWILTPIAYVRENYNFNQTLRRVTLIKEKVENDINIFNFYRLFHAVKDTLDRQVRLDPTGQIQNQIRLTNVFAKHLRQIEPITNPIVGLQKQAKKHQLSSFEQYKIFRAMEEKVNPESVIGDRCLNRAFAQQRIHIHENENMNRSNSHLVDKRGLEMVDRRDLFTIQEDQQKGK